MQRTLPVLLITASLLGCENTPSPHYAEMLSEAPPPLSGAGYSPARHNVKLSSYVEQMVILLQQNSRTQIKGNIAVASFVNFDNNLRSTNAVGNQLAENFVTQLQHFGYNVYDSKLTRSISLNNQGDFVFSRETRSLKHNRNLCCVVAGTMIYTSDGIEVRARLMDLATKAVLSSASTTIPYFVVDHLGTPQ